MEFSVIPRTPYLEKSYAFVEDGTLTGTTTPGKSGPGSNDNEKMTPYSPELQNQNLTTRSSFVSNQDTPFEELLFLLQLTYSKPH